MEEGKEERVDERGIRGRRYLVWTGVKCTRGIGGMDDIIPAWKCKRYFKFIKKELLWHKIVPKDKLSFLHRQFALMLQTALDLTFKGYRVHLPTRYGTMYLELRKCKAFDVRHPDFEHSRVERYVGATLCVQGWNISAGGMHPFTGKKLFNRRAFKFSTYLSGGKWFSERAMEAMYRKDSPESGELEFQDWKHLIPEEESTMFKGQYDLYTMGTKSMVRVFERRGSLLLYSKARGFWIRANAISSPRIDEYKGNFLKLEAAIKAFDDNVTPEVYLPIFPNMRKKLNEGLPITAFKAYRSSRAGTMVGDFEILKPGTYEETKNPHIVRIPANQVSNEDFIPLKKVRFKWLKEHRKMRSRRDFPKIMGL